MVTIYFHYIAVPVGWHRGVAVEHRTRDREVAGLSLSRALWRKNLLRASFSHLWLVHDG